MGRGNNLKMYNLETCFSLKSSWRSFLVVFCFFLLSSYCTTTGSDQKRDQLAKRMTGGEKVKHTDLFYARVYTFRETKKKDYTKLTHKLLRRCAGTFIFVDLVLTISQCVLFKNSEKNRIVTDKTIVHLDDFDQPRKNILGLIQNFTVGVKFIHQNPFTKSRLLQFLGSPTHDLVLLQTELFSYNFWPLHVLPIPPCREKTDINNTDYQLKMLGMKKGKAEKRWLFKRYAIEEPFNKFAKKPFLFDPEFVQEAEFEEVDPMQLFKRVYKNKKFFIWDFQKKAKPKPLPSHRIAAFSKKGAEMGDNDEIGSPAFLYNEEKKMPQCLYGVLSGFISGQTSDTFQSRGYAQNVTAVVLEGAFFYYDEWLKDEINKGWKRWEDIDPKMVQIAKAGF